MTLPLTCNVTCNALYAMSLAMHVGKRIFMTCNVTCNAYGEEDIYDYDITHFIFVHPDQRRKMHTFNNKLLTHNTPVERKLEWLVELWRQSMASRQDVLPPCLDYIVKEAEGGLERIDH